MFETILKFLEEDQNMMNENNNQQQENLSLNETAQDLIVVGVVSALTAVTIKGIKFAFKKFDEKLASTDTYQEKILPKVDKSKSEAKKAKDDFEEKMRILEEERKKKEEEEMKAKEENEKSSETEVLPESNNEEEENSSEENEEDLTLDELLDELEEEDDEEEIEDFSEEDEDILNYLDEDTDEMTQEEKLQALERAKKFQSLRDKVGISPIFDKLNKDITHLATEEIERYLESKDIELQSNGKYMATSKTVFVNKLNDIYKVIGSDVVISTKDINIGKLISGEETFVKSLNEENDFVWIYPLILDKFSFAVVTFNTVVGSIDYALFIYNNSDSYELVDEYSFDIC